MPTVRLRRQGCACSLWLPDEDRRRALAVGDELQVSAELAEELISAEADGWARVVDASPAAPPEKE